MIEKNAILRTICIGSLMLLPAAPLFAQIQRLGVKGGVNLANQHIVGDDDSDPGLKMFTGLVAGAFVTLPVASWLELQPEALYSVKGSRVDEEGVTASVQIDYLEVPVLARFSKRGAGRNGYYFAGGPFAAFRLRARTRATFSGATEEIDIGEDVERLDFGLTGGGGVEIGSWVFDGRYTHGLKDIDKDKSDSVKVTSRAVSITAGFRF